MKRFNEKLVLNKETIANLEIDEIKRVQGGGTQKFTCIPEECYRPTLWPTCPLQTDTEPPICN
jgi:hypothetical protein